ncbi:MAG: hypothetical protein Q8Q20_05380, partial [bacterium]|nr:hypothetical protein [bacterium]
KHSDDVCGTHHARDVRRVFETLGVQAPIISSSLQIPTMLMHTLRFSFRVSGDIPSRETVLEAFRERALLATSEYQYASEVFSAARDQGFNGRLLEQTVVVAPTVAVIGDRIVGFCFTPQDGNSLLSSVAAIVEDIDPEGWWDRMANFQKWQFGRV